MSITAITSMLVGPVADLIGKFIPDKDQAAKLAHDIAIMAATQAHQQAMGQVEVNKVEAAHRSVWVAGWRPAIGWTCALGLFWNVIGHPVLDIWFDMPHIDPSLLYPVMLGILGIGGANVVARTYEKVKGVAV
jgi:hypothetical protein|tara:strand:+ start:568 stop:966 length:399 start_codon:yes stop_codon:yes gene_type:complete